MRVLHCIPNLYGGGAERQLAYLTSGLQESGIDTHVACLDGGPNLQRLKESRITIHVLRAAGNHDPLLAFRLLRLANELKPQIIQTWLRQMDILGGSVATLLSIPWVLSERSSKKAYPKTMKHLLRAALAHRASIVVSNSEGGREYWKPIVGSRKTTLIPNGIPIHEIVGSTWDGALEGVSKDTKIVLFAGRLIRERNLQVLVEALARLTQVENLLALICGEGPEREPVLAQIAKSGLEGRVRLLGYQGEKQLWGLMKRANVLVSLSKFEGHPNAVLEAISSRVPLIVSDIPEHRAFLDGACARLVDPSNVEAVAKAITDLLSDESLARAQADRAFAFAPLASVGEMVARYRRIYSELLHQEPVE